MDGLEQTEHGLRSWSLSTHAVAAVVVIFAFYVLLRFFRDAKDEAANHSNVATVAVDPVASARLASDAANAARRNAKAASSEDYLSFFNAAPQTPLGVEYGVNPQQAIPFESPLAHGCYLPMAVPTHDPVRCKAGDYPYSDHFHKRRRLWEVRLQFTLREAVDASSIFFGVEQDKYVPVQQKNRTLGNAVLAGIRRVAPGFHETYGENPETTHGEAERPVITFPLWIIDQVVVTPGDQPKPNLCGEDFPTLGITKSNDRKKFKKFVEELKLLPGPTYSFGFWCFARYVDVYNWRSTSQAMGCFPEVPLLDISILPPLYFAMYSLTPAVKEKRHLDSRKKYLWRIVFWPSSHPPEPERVKEIQAGHFEFSFDRPLVGKATPQRLDEITEEYWSKAYGKYKYCGLRDDPLKDAQPPMYSLQNMNLPLCNATPDESDKVRALQRRLGTLSTAHRTDLATLIRYLRARDGDIDKAEALFREAAQWKLDVGAYQSLSSWNLEVYERCLAPWWPCGGFIGHGLQGEPVGLERLGICNFSKLTELLPWDAFQKIDIVHAQRSLAALEEDALRRRGPVGNAILIVDMEGFALSHWGYHALVKMAKIIEGRSFILTEVTKCILLVRSPPLTAIAWAMLKPLLDPATAEKFHFVSTRNTPALLEKYVDLSEIPAYLGGNKIVNGDPECRQIVAPGGMPTAAAASRFFELLSRVENSETNGCHKATAPTEFKENGHSALDRRSDKCGFCYRKCS